MKYKKVYVSFNALSRMEKDEFERTSHLFYETDLDKIFEEVCDGSMKYSTTSEIYILICSLRNKGYEDIEILIEPSLFIYNEDLYKIEFGKVVLMETENVGFFSVRGYNWSHPFFYLLRKILEDKGGKLTKTNYSQNKLNDNGKFRPIVEMYKQREKLVGDIIVPHDIRRNEYDLLRLFIKNNLGKKIVIKKSLGEYGKEVYMVDLKNYNDLQQSKFETNLDTHLEKGKEIYITPFSTFINEHRVYFTNFNNVPKVYSVKMKKLKWEESDIFSESNFFYKGKFSWSDMTNKEMAGKYKYIIDLSKEYVSNINYTVGVLEFGEKEDGSTVLFEVNHMGASLCTTKEDSDNMKEYYLETFGHYLD